MVRISDIFKKAKEKAPGLNEDSGQPAAGQIPAKKQFFSNLVKIKAEKAEGNLPAGEISITCAVNKEAELPLSIKGSTALYEKTLSSVGGLFKDNVDCSSFDIKGITECVEDIASRLISGDKNLLPLTLIIDSIEPNYLIYHSVNTCIYSIEIGLGLGYEKPGLIDLGCCAIFHDIGMVKYLNIAGKPERLTVKEYTEVKDHTLFGSMVLKEIKGMKQIFLDAAYQHHERIDGSGYPQGLKEEAILPYAKIISLIDVYEALTHRRAYRLSLLPIEAIKEILDNKNIFDYKLVKILMERIGVYPLGSIVELNTREIARVIKLNYEVPLRPVVELVSDIKDNVPNQIKILDLRTQPTIYIKGNVRKV